MSTTLTQQDLAQAAKLLERLRTGEMQVTSGSGAITDEGDTFKMLQRVEAYLSEGIRRMDAPIGDGGPAFPEAGLSGLPNGEFMNGRAGMSLRDYFAAKVFPIAADQYKDGHADGWEGIARHAYMLADAMVKARSS